jgi:hypothetical protein
MACVLCATEDDPTDEDVIPKWLLRAFKVQDGSGTVSVAEEAGEKHEIHKLYHFMLTLNGGLCATCNGNKRLGGLEQAVQPILEPMAARGAQVTLSLDDQRMLAVWAIKTIYLVELASRQQYPDTRPVEGYAPSSAEIGWLLAQLEQRKARDIEPPPRSMVWLSAVDCKKPDEPNSASLVLYAPSTAVVRAADGSDVAGHFTTLGIGFVAFQVFTVDFVQAERIDSLRTDAKAQVWNSFAPDSIAASVPRISSAQWPNRCRGRRPPSRMTASTGSRTGTWCFAGRHERPAATRLRTKGPSGGSARCDLRLVRAPRPEVGPGGGWPARV